MSTEITWLGHNAWSIRAGEHRLLLDPFLNDNPLSPKKADQVEADFILVSHGHGDHRRRYGRDRRADRGHGHRDLRSLPVVVGPRGQERACHESRRRLLPFPLAA